MPLKKILIFSSLCALTLIPVASFAIDVQSQLGATAGESGAGFAVAQDPRLIAANIVKISLSLLGVLFVAYAVYAGFMIMTARGEEERIEEGKKTLQRAIIGLVIILSAFSITLLAEKIATGDRKHQGDYIEIQNTDVDFQDRDQRRQQDRLGCQFGLQMQPDGTCGAYENVP